MKSHLNALNLFVFLLHLNLSSSLQLASDQVSSMTAIYDIFLNNTTPPVWNTVSRESTPCSWLGVDCAPDNSSVVNISFSLFSISTSDFLPLLCNLSTLHSIDVSNNHLSSAIPQPFFTACARLPFLKSLNFSRNKFSGHLPPFHAFISLETLDFSYNSFSGQIPANLGQGYLLRELHLSFNNFTGEIPPQIITTYTNLTLIDLSVNNLLGPIPDEIGSLPSLQILLLSVNNLTGAIPTSLSNVTTLSRFAANQNAFNGTIPSGITSFLRSLDLSFNKLTGTIPPDFLNGPNLTSVDLSYNQLVGPIPPGDVSVSLFRLRLGSNHLNGSIPFALGNLVNLTYLELDNNTFTGLIPLELGMCRMMALLNLAQNGLSGPLPPIFGALTNLQVLNLQINSFVGEIPTGIISLNRLQKLNMSSNSLNGSIPFSISSLTNLTNLDLHANNFSGTIPDSIGRLSNLLQLELGKNQLSGRIPDMPPNLQIALNLSYNHFGGPIPATLSTLSSIEVLDLSNNGFSGQIPGSLTELRSLTQLDLSNNNLSGVRPTFGNYVNVNTTGNNVTIPTADPPSSPPRKRKPVKSEIIIAVTCAVAAAGLLILISMLISRRYNRINDEDLPSGEEPLAPQVIHGNLLTPNSIHRSHIDFGHAMEAIMNSTNLKWKTRFSTYYEVVMPTGGRYFVKKLNWSDKILQLGNNERFGRELQILGKLCNSNVMIPLAYVLTMDSAYLFYDFAPEGTLFEVLHSRIGSQLDWASRYSITIGVSQGLAFLHDCNAGPILLLDLSSKSIMLKSFNEPHIGDIELCRVIDPSKSIGSLSTVAGSVGYVPPEYAYTMRVTAAGNVYSFGVVLLELVTGKPAVSGGTELAKWVLSNSAEQSKWDQILDFSVSKSSVAVRSQMLAVLKVALACVSASPEARPKMKSVLRMLLNAR